MFKKVIFNTGSQIVGKVVTASSTLLITLLIGRSLGPSGFGEFTKIFVFVGYFYTLADFGLNSIFVKLADDKSISNLFKTLLGLRLVMASLLTLFAIIIAFFLPYNTEAATGFSPLVKTGIIIASLTIITHALFTTANAYFQKNLRYDLSVLAIIAGSLIMVLATIIVFLTTKSLLYFVAIYILGGIAYAAASFLLLKKKFAQGLSFSFNFIESKKLINLSWPIGAALILNLLYFRIDIFILASFRDSAEVGVYGLGYQFFEAALAVPIFFANSLYPILTNIYKEKVAEFKKIVKMWTFYLIAASILLAAALFLIAYLIPVIYDVRFEGSRLALQILSLGMPFFFVSALFWYLLIISNKQKLLIYIYGSGAVFNLIANLIFIPIYGFVAAAATTVVSEIFILLLQIIALRVNLPRKLY